MEKEKNFLLWLVAPHSKISREVTEKDIEKVVEEANILYNLCFTPNGIINGALAMAHPQIDDNDPLRFFVTAKRELIINPKIIRATNTTIDSKEGCASFPNEKPIIVQRHNKIEIEFITLIVDPDNKDKFKFSSVLNDNLSGKQAKIFSHEIDHLNGVYIYNINN